MASPAILFVAHVLHPINDFAVEVFLDRDVRHAGCRRGSMPMLLAQGVLYGIAAALPHMTQQKAEHIINVSSVAGHKVGPGFAVYSATKYAVRALSEGLRQEVKPYNIRTTVISPGAVATELPDSISDQATAESIRKFYADVAIPAESFARTVAFAISQPEDVDVNEIVFRPTRHQIQGNVCKR
jgi:NADP-dependent 3-hydroxy acid dehydrogenase YdfG